MKANAPKKIYLNPLLMEDGESICRECSFERMSDSQVEYICTDSLPSWKKSTLPNNNVTGINSEYLCYKGYRINYKELFDKLPKED